MKIENVQEHWLTIYNWLKQAGSNPDKNFCREEITTHPDYPSLLSTIDFLDTGGMTYQAVNADASYINEFSYPLLAHIKQPDNEYMHIVPNAAAWDAQKEITQYWSGITVYPEKGSIWQSTQNIAYRQTASRNKFIALVLAIFGIGIFCFASIQGLINEQIGIWNVSFGLFSLTGLVISIYALGTELGFQSKLVKQVCGAIGGTGGCEQVFKSKYAKGVLGITPADAAVLYFATQFIMYILGCWQTGLINCIVWLALAGIFIAAVSVYAQAVLLKQWCALCLGIVAVLLVQALLIAPSLQNMVQMGNLVGAMGLFAFAFLLFTFTWLPIKQLLKNNNGNKPKLAELKKWKTDAGLFISQWQQEQEVDTNIWENDLLLGNPTAPLLITVACNPYCAPCARAHVKLEEMLTRFDGKLKVLIRFICPHPANAGDAHTKALTALLKNAAVVENNIVLAQSLNDWFAFMDYEKWTAKWQSEIEAEVTGRLLQHNNWTQQNGISFTPTFFLNGKKVPGRYALEDIALLVTQLVEMMGEKTT